MKILIIRLSSIGDCVLASPVVEALQERYPHAQLTWAVQAKSVPVVRGLPGLRETLLWDDSTRRYSRLGGTLWRTWRRRFDVALDLHGLDKAGLFMLASRAKRRISGESAHKITHWSSNERIMEDTKVHAREFYLRRAGALDIAPDAISRFFPRVPVTALHRRFADEFFAQAGVLPSHRVIGLNLGAAHAMKQWAPERFARLANELLAEDSNTRMVVFGAPADMPLLERFESELARCQPPHTGTPRPGMAWAGRLIVAVGRINLMQLAAVAERCAAFVTADTGPMHIVAAVGAPIVALFGPTDVALTGPVRKPEGAPIRVINAREWVKEARPAMENISVEQVWREVRDLVAEVEDIGLAPRLRLLPASNA
jgi:heptosyltransferase-1